MAAMAGTGWLERPQKNLGCVGLMTLLVCTSMMMPLSLDMYTPSVPHMAEHLSTTTSMVNLTLVGYNFFFAVGLLVFGPLSDRKGRQPVLLAGSCCLYGRIAPLCHRTDDRGPDRSAHHPGARCWGGRRDDELHC